MSDHQVLDLEDKARLNLTLTTREKIITTLTEGGKIPDNDEDRSFLIKALDGMDRTVLSRAKIRNDENANKTNQDTARMVGEMLSRVNMRMLTPQRSEPPKLANDTIDLIEGETFIGVQPVKYDEIIKDH